MELMNNETTVEVRMLLATHSVSKERFSEQRHWFLKMYIEEYRCISEVIS